MGCNIASLVEQDDRIEATMLAILDVMTPAEREQMRTMLFEGVEWYRKIEQVRDMD